MDAMTVYVFRDGKLVEKTEKTVSHYRFKEYTSPVDGAWITSPRQRERDLNRADAYDPRDKPFEREREQRKQANEPGNPGRQLDFWR